jgi:hypothetical protein
MNHYDILDKVVNIDDEAYYLNEVPLDDLVEDEDADEDGDEAFGLDALMGDYGWDDCEV